MNTSQIFIQYGSFNESGYCVPVLAHFHSHTIVIQSRGLVRPYMAYTSHMWGGSMHRPIAHSPCRGKPKHKEWNPYQDRSAKNIENKKYHLGLWRSPDRPALKASRKGDNRRRRKKAVCCSVPK
ncbi:hypothetical protein E2C01_074932 [Portunus trituberculatus]|uniref:Uncharacterized protein n=1 Tax=Portunus trituberculatus TaxID=210409 RepID=A0A5B7III6_PORTR|nr:hypothetical protein [Portunus trituberculatus]